MVKIMCRVPAHGFIFYAVGIHGTQKVETIGSFRKAAKWGHTKVQYSLGMSV